MKKVRNRVRRQQSDQLRPSRVENAFEALLRTCAKLPIAHRERFILLLLQQVFLPGGIACYLAWGERDLSAIRPIYVSLLDISTDLAESWFEWARTLFNEGSSCSPQERVFCLIGELTKQISIEEVNLWLQGRPALLFSDGV
jgi:hypothetical protein